MENRSSIQKSTTSLEFLDDKSDKKSKEKNTLESERKRMAGKVYKICESNYLYYLDELVKNGCIDDEIIKCKMEIFQKLLAKNRVFINSIIRNTHSTSILIFDLFLTFHESLYFKILIYENELKSQIENLNELIDLFEETCFEITGKLKIGDLSSEQIQFHQDFDKQYVYNLNDTNDKIENSQEIPIDNFSLEKLFLKDKVTKYNNLNLNSNNNSNENFEGNNIEKSCILSNTNLNLIESKVSKSDNSSNNSDLLISFDCKFTNDNYENKFTNILAENKSIEFVRLN